MIRRFILVLALVIAVRGESKNLDGRFGFGPSFHSFSSTAGLSLKYFHTQLLATNFLLAFNTESATYLFGAKSLRHVILEENMNVFLGVGAFVINDKANNAPSETGLEFDALMGGEFFLPGLPNLGLQFEVGIGLRTLRTTSFRSVGGGFANGALHYYF